MNVGMACAVAARALRRNAMRTGLTALGMIIGVAAVIVMVAIGNGAKASIESQIRSAGSNLVMVMAGSTGFGPVRQGQGATTTLTVADADAIRAEVGGIRYLSPGVSTRAQVVAETTNWGTQVQGTGEEFATLRAWPVERGVFLSATDVARSANVAVLGAVVRDQLFGAGADPTGAVIRIRNTPFRVIGVLSRKGQAAMGQAQDDVGVVPYPTAQKRLLGITHVHSLTISADSSASIEAMSAAIAEVLRRRHRLAAGDEDDFMVRSMEEMASVLTATTTTMTWLLGAVAAVSLLVGGIGIMNIMLVSVTERTKEIGLRLSVGASDLDVLLQFLIEAVVLSVAGGLIGILLGVTAAAAVGRLMAWPVAVTAGAVTMAFAFAVAVGIFFGFYPARKAAALNPIDALRYE
ncbi:MAG: ABC transporter permease [Vicinamibacterales bacterium]